MIDLTDIISKSEFLEKHSHISKRLLTNHCNYRSKYGTENCVYFYQNSQSKKTLLVIEPKMIEKINDHIATAKHEKERVRNDDYEKKANRLMNYAASCTFLVARPQNSVTK